MIIRQGIALALALLPGPMLAQTCPEGLAALHAAIALNLLDDAALLDARGVRDGTLDATPDQVAALIAEAFALTPAAEHLLIYTQTDTGLCALVFDGVTVTATAARPGQTAASRTQARLALSAALNVEARQIQRAGQMRGAGALAGVDVTGADPAEAAAHLADFLMLPDLAPALIGADEILILPGNDIGTVPLALLPLPGSARRDAGRPRPASRRSGALVWRHALWRAFRAGGLGLAI